MKNIVLIGGGGFSSEVADIAIQNGFNVLGYTDNIRTASSLKI